MKTLYIIRGLPGSGKTTLAKSISPNGHTVEADMYFEKTVDGETVYEWDGSKLPQAHRWVNEQVRGLMEQGEEKIAVSNTNTRLKEFKEYIDLAKEYGYRYHVITVENYHDGENTYDVPEYAIDRQEQRYELKLRNKRVKVNQ